LSSYSENRGIMTRISVFDILLDGFIFLYCFRYNSYTPAGKKWLILWQNCHES